MAKGTDVQAIQVLVDGMTFGGSVFNRGAVVLDATEEMVVCADSKRRSDDGHLLCRRITKQEALRAAKKHDAGEEGVIVAEAVKEPSVADVAAEDDEDEESVAPEE